MFPQALQNNSPFFIWKTFLFFVTCPLKTIWTGAFFLKWHKILVDEQFLKHFYIFELHFTKMRDELTDTGREHEKKIVGGLGVFNTSKLFLEKQETTCMCGSV